MFVFHRLLKYFSRTPSTSLKAQFQDSSHSALSYQRRVYFSPSCDTKLWVRGIPPNEVLLLGGGVVREGEVISCDMAYHTLT